jgi:hypothetical protein
MDETIDNIITTCNLFEVVDNVLTKIGFEYQAPLSDDDKNEVISSEIKKALLGAA